jgi:aspartate dehydrogenase
MTSVGLIGCGGMAQDVVAALCGARMTSGVRIIGALARPGRGGEARAKLCGVDIVEALDELLARKPTLVAEVAGQVAVAEHADAVLRRGIDCLLISVGALADAALLRRLKSAARDGNSRILLPAGAVGGIDAIAAMRFAGLTSVRYRSRKPPLAWRGSPAERLVDLGKLCERTVLYTGTAGEAALLYLHPQNANVAAAVALAGLGFDATEVELVADPDAPGNVHEIEAEGAAGRFAIQLQGKPSRTNPKTSALAAFSVARALLNEQATIVI